jgi:hypothetical protein
MIAVGIGTLVVAGTAIVLPIMLGQSPGGVPGADRVQASVRVSAQACSPGIPPVRVVPVNPSGPIAVPVNPSAVMTKPGEPPPRVGPMSGVAPIPLPYQDYLCPSVTVTGTVHPLPPAKEARTTDELRQRNAEIQAYVGRQLSLLVPDAMQITPGTLGVSDGRLDNATGFTVRGKRLTLGVAVFTPGAAGTPVPGQDCASDCRITRAPDGTVLMVRTEKSTVSATNFRATGTVVRVTVGDYDPEGTLLTVLATDPALGP